MSRGKPFETHPSLFGGLPPGPAPAVGGHLNPLFSSHLQAAASVPGLHNPYFGLPNPFLPGVTGAGATMSGGQKSPTHFLGKCYPCISCQFNMSKFILMTDLITD